MAIIIALWFAVFTYAAFFLIAFKDREDFSRSLNSFLNYFPVSFMLERVISTTSGPYSKRIAAFLPSGIVVGMITFRILELL